MKMNTAVLAGRRGKKRVRAHARVCTCVCKQDEDMGLWGTERERIRTVDECVQNPIT